MTAVPNRVSVRDTSDRRSTAGTPGPETSDPPDGTEQWPECHGCRRTRLSGRVRLGGTFRHADRSFVEILQEIRVAQTGVQLLVAFLLTAPFSQRFPVDTTAERALYVTSLVAGAFASALLIAPVPFHRLVYARRMKRELVRASNRFAQYGTAFMLISVISALTLVLDTATGSGTAAVAVFGCVVWFVGWWYFVPFLSMLRCRRQRR